MRMMLEHCLGLAELACRFSDVPRATVMPDGERAESDATHTIMLQLVASSLAVGRGLDIGLVVSFAMVHDLPEAYAGDVDTFGGLTLAQQLDKTRREKQALSMITEVAGRDSWLVDMLQRYEAQIEPEARFVRYLDKLMPRLTGILSDGAAARRRNVDGDVLGQLCADQDEHLAAEYPEFGWLADLFWASGQVLTNIVCSLDRDGSVAVGH